MSMIRSNREFVVRAISVALGGLLLVGCGDGASTTTVQGKISYKGTPPVHGVINFAVAGQRPMGGFINPDGTFQVELPPGEYQVRIDSPPRIPDGVKEGDPLPKLEPRLIPEKFADFESSGLTATIGSESPQQLDFLLK
jgi:hypothetical protein